MSGLLESAFEDFTIIDKQTLPDGYGGTTHKWVDGAPFKGAVTYDGSTEMKVAEAAGSTAAYTLTVRKNVDLGYRTVIRRERDKKIFRALANSDENQTPDGAHLNMRQYPAEEWTLD